MGMKGYKAFKPGWKCKDFQYEIGKTYELPAGQKLEICECGFHFCKNPIDVFGYYPMTKGVLIAEVEALGEIQQEGTKYVTDKIKIVRELRREVLQAFILDGKHNTGYCNSGSNNTGNCNSGSRNTGDHNSGNGNYGNFNSGDYNTGYHNIGNGNTGHCNTGHCNTGYCNSGDRNSGDYNTGYYNSGNGNSGCRNTGYLNSGDYNTGHYNSGNYNSGIFNSNEPNMRAFNRETNIRLSDFLRSLDYNFYNFCTRIYENNLEEGDVDRIKALPNYDPDIFFEITGIDLRGEKE